MGMAEQSIVNLQAQMEDARSNDENFAELRESLAAREAEVEALHAEMTAKREADGQLRSELSMLRAELAQKDEQSAERAREVEALRAAVQLEGSLREQLKAELATQQRTLAAMQRHQHDESIDLRQRLAALVKAKGQMRTRIGKFGEAIAELSAFRTRTLEHLDTLGTRADLAALDVEATDRNVSTMRSNIECVIAAEAALIRSEITVVKAEFHDALEIEERRELTNSEEDEMEAFLAKASHMAGLA
jgi:chromosome segregation ATPase